MQEEELQIPIYFMAGFLESGKSEFLKFTVEQDYFQIDETTLLILCEEGEIEYDQKTLKECNTQLVVLESQEELTQESLEQLDEKYHPGRVIIEYNGMWPVSDFEKLKLPMFWKMAQHITVIDASTFQMYLNNMKSLVMDMVRNADLVIFNRCQQDSPLAMFRRNIKAVNQRAEIIFEDEEGEIENIFEDDLPYDLNDKVIHILPEDYGIFYIDALDHKEHYNGKTISFTGMVLKSKDFPTKVFVPGRMAMTCCADDTTFIGFLCKSPYGPKLKTGEWVKVTATVQYEKQPAYHGEGPVLYADFVEKTEPLKEELVYFN